MTKAWDMRVRVECYAGRKGDERPVRFWFDDHKRVVEEVIDQWYGPSDAFFKIRANDILVYVLRHDTSVPDGEWSLIAFGNSQVS
jgi:hypothetical protein